jgi:WD40 repeat protein/tRNA A-37 threonylcarbamoyl transferase component Bud32
VAEWTAEQWGRISAHLDRALELEGQSREAWIAELERNDAAIGRQLRELLGAHAANSAAAFLERSPLSRAAGWAPEGEATNYRSQIIGRQFGSYRVLSLLGHGGMGSVWLAERVDGLFTRRVALKLIHPALVSQLTTERFSREREILASLDHPNITRLIDAGFAADDQPYLALEYVDGKPITDYCDERCLSVRERLELLRQVLSAVQYAHAHLVIHRDLKPSTILGTQDGQTHLLDFGIAKLLTEGEAKETELTRVGGRALTPDYAAPEQIAGAPITTAADVYALGVMFYELLTGERPYKLKRDSRGALEEAILRADPVAPSRAALSKAAAAARAMSARKLSSAFRGELDTIAAKALKKSPIERYATANAFGEDISRFLRGDVVLAQADSVAYRTLKFARRHRVGIAAASVLLVTLVGGLAATSYEARIAALQRDAAVEAQLRSLTQTAAARLISADVPAVMAIILEVLPHRGAKRSYTPAALSVFQEARAADAQVLAITGHTDRVRTAAFSPDGRRIVTASYDNTSRIWDAATGQQIMLLGGHADGVRSAAYSPDGQLIVTASFDKTARIWDAATGRQVMLLSGHSDKLRSAAFSPDGRRIVTASYDKTARIWDAATGRQIMLLSGHEGVVTSAAYSPDGQRIVTASFDKTARIWDAATGRQIMLLSGHSDLETAAFAPDGGRILTASLDKTARIWDAVTGREMVQMKGHSQLVIAAAFSPDGKRVVTASDDRTARIWDAATGQQVMLLIGHGQQVADAAFSPDGQRVVTASDDQTARLWDVAPSRPIMLLNGHTQLVNGAAFSPDGGRVATASADKTVRVWGAATGREVMLLSGHAELVSTAAFSADGRRIVTASNDKTARIWDAATGRELMLLSGHTNRVTCAEFSPDGRRVLTASSDKTARIWDASTGREIARLSGHKDWVNWAAFSPDGKLVVTASLDLTARVWDAATGREIMVLGAHTNGVEMAQFSPDGRRIVTASDDKTARIWDAAMGREIMVLGGHEGIVVSAAFSSDGRRVVTGSADKTARIWDAETGQQLMVMPHADLVETTAFSPLGDRIVTASDDGTARIWDAGVPAIDIQIAWAEAAQFDGLASTERFQLGLPVSIDIRRWPLDKSECDGSAAAIYDPDRRTAGVTLDHIVTDIALRACAKTDERTDHRARFTYQHGRALMASGMLEEAKREFEAAVGQGYPAARVDLGMLLSQPSANMHDLTRAITLLEKSWSDGVAIAAFELGSLYEHGVRSPAAGANRESATDETRAWRWYQKGADAREPNALARFAQRAGDAAFAEQDAASRNSHWLESFKYYAAAAERARREDWPIDAWRDWRYRRATLARLLAREGAMQAVAAAYDDVRRGPD